MEKKIYTFRAKAVTYGFISVEAESFEEARTMRNAFQENNRGEFNEEMGSGEFEIESEGYQEPAPDDGTHLYTTARQNAKANATAFEDLQEELKDEA